MSRRSQKRDEENYRRYRRRYDRAHREHNREYFRDWYGDNAERERARHRAIRTADPDSYNARRRENYRSARVRAAWRQWSTTCAANRRAMEDRNVSGT